MKAKKPTKSTASIDTVSEAIAELTRVIDKLALSTAKGFSETASQRSLDHGMERVETRLDDIEFRIGKIESNHDRRLGNLEDKYRILSTAFEKQLKIKLPK